MEVLTPSIGTIDNAVAETAMGLFKNEAVAKGAPVLTRPLTSQLEVAGLVDGRPGLLVLWLAFASHVGGTSVRWNSSISITMKSAVRYPRLPLINLRHENLDHSSISF